MWSRGIPNGYYVKNSSSHMHHIQLVSLEDHTIRTFSLSMRQRLGTHLHRDLLWLRLAGYQTGGYLVPNSTWFLAHLHTRDAVTSRKFTLGKHFYRFTLYIDPRMRTGPVSKGVIKLCRIPFEPYPETLRDRIWNNMAYHSLDFTRNHWTYTNKQNCRIRLSLKVLTRCQLKFISPFMGYSPETHLVYNFFQHGPQQYFCQ